MELALTFLLLIGLEIVLGVDNLLLISIITGRLPEHQRFRGRFIGLGLGLLLRCVLLFFAAWLVRLNDPVIWTLSWKSLILLGGGGFLLVKAVREIHAVVEHEHGDSHEANGMRLSFSNAISQIVMLDIVFSIDSIITAVGLTDQLAVIYGAVVGAFCLVLLFSGPIAAFIHKHAALKILALAFLVTIGVTLVIEGLGGHVPKGYIYLPMGFALAVELLQMRFDANRRIKRK
jgi:predicted tellurium resistance membrane protein TerC